MATIAETEPLEGEPDLGEDPEAATGEEIEGEPAPDDAGNGADDDETPLEAPEGFDPTAFEKEQTRHARAIAKALGAAFGDMKVCETCGGIGFETDLYEPPPALLDDPSLVVCGECNGYGQRRTPSLSEQYLTTPCSACSGTGYRDRAQLEAQAQAAAYTQAAQAQPQIAPQPVWNQATGQWETPDGRPLVAAYAPPPAYPQT